MGEQSNLPMAHHVKFMSHFKLGSGDPVGLAHESYCRIMQAMVSYDCLDISNLASAELVARQLQLLEEKQQQLCDNDKSGAAEEAALFAGGLSGSGAVVVAPELKSFISTEMAREASVLKERRKAREERALARNPKKG